MTAVFDASRSQLPRARQICARDLRAHSLSVSPDTSNEDVRRIFTRDKSLISLPVVEAQKAIGLINRNIFMSQVSKPFHQEIYGKRSCIAFMDKEPMQVTEGLPIEALTFKAVASGEKAFSDGFIITDEDNDYLGMGLGMDLMNLVAELQAEKNRQITHSIDYASVIQRAMLRQSRTALQKSCHDAHLIWEPRDTVGGDFYHFARYPDGWFAAIADCTGHGVPGAFMTLIASSCLSQALEQHGPRNPAALLAGLNTGIKQLLGQFDTAVERPESDDGLDAGLLWYDSIHNTLTYAGAKTALYYLPPNTNAVAALDGARMGVGYVDTPVDFEWPAKTLQIEPNTLFFITTDGLVDQIGGPKRIAFGKRQIREALIDLHLKPTAQICQNILTRFSAWQGAEPRRDDLTFFCFRSR